MKDWDNEEIFKEYLNKDTNNEFSIYFGKDSVKQMFIEDGAVKINNSGWITNLMDSTPYVRQRFLNEMRRFYN